MLRGATAVAASSRAARAGSSARPASVGSTPPATTDSGSVSGSRPTADSDADTVHRSASDLGRSTVPISAPSIPTIEDA
jgi:hypothetical protein